MRRQKHTKEKADEAHFEIVNTLFTGLFVLPRVVALALSSAAAAAAARLPSCRLSSSLGATCCFKADRSSR